MTASGQTIRARFEAERTIPLDRYQEDGCQTRVAYLEGLAENIGTTLEAIEEVVDLMGPDEDFDGTPVFLEEHAEAFQ